MKKFVYILLILFVIGLAGTLVTVNANGGFSFDTNNVSDKAVIDNDGIKKLKVDLSSSDVSIHPTTDKEITVELSGKISKKLKKKIKLAVRENGDTAEVSLKNENQIKFNIGVLIVDTNVDIYMPKEMFESIRLETSSGDIAAEGLTAKEISLQSSSGDIAVENSKAEDLFAIQTSSGDISSMKNSGEKLDMKASSGDINVKDQESREAVIQSSSGEIRLRNISGNLAADSSSGDIFIKNKEITGDFNAESSSGDITIEFDKNPSSLAFDFRGNSGEGKVEFGGVKYEEKKENELIGTIGLGEYKLKARTNSGDFTLR
ncbi:DUF4097 family beta strand repeat-containing protein [Neobacillus sp. PS3-34]|uniref:DUF4097 family beta strand repeat-containing protein n=1 Tax=Neobacillus sp. PS3-34 TaxID=3070678 RepID=UPI0027DEF2DE|nr:DUF4097 family beta strand repeat-containing protein [Neobacillus sp. PS3-34]WML50222.1 DUF4097 family beta strand repeat-containing protein [Neobacillus sp. PS3-34]